MAPQSTTLTTKVETGSPYQLDNNQTLKASSTLLKHISQSAVNKENIGEKKDLLAGDPSNAAEAEPIWLVLSTKKHIVPQQHPKPGKILLPHSLNTSPNQSICLITPDPQRPFKDLIAHPSFPSDLSKRITRVIGVEKLKKKYHAYEAQRQLRDSHDIFLADERIVTYLSKIVGKTFYKSAGKRPLPVRLSGTKHKAEKKNAALPSTKPKKDEPDAKSIATPQAAAQEIERTISTTPVYLSPSISTSVRVGLSSQSPSELTENIKAVVAGMVERFVPRQWRGVKTVHIKGANTMALPLWLADELWEDENKILEDAEAEEKKTKALRKARKRRALENDGAKARDVDNDDEESRKRKAKAEETLDVKPKRRKAEDDGLSQDMKERREKLRKQKKELKAAMEGTGSKANVQKVVETVA